MSGIIIFHPWRGKPILRESNHFHFIGTGKMLNSDLFKNILDKNCLHENGQKIKNFNIYNIKYNYLKSSGPFLEF